MEKIFNFFRFSNSNQNSLDTSQTLGVTLINKDGRVLEMQCLMRSTVAEIISIALVELEAPAKDYREHKLIHVRNGNVLNYNTTMEEAGVLDNDEIILMEDNKFLNKNTAINRAPDQAAINDVTGYVENGAVEKTFNFKRSFIKLFIGDHSYIRNFLMMMATESAYVISTGPHADFLIDYFKQQIIGRRRHRDDAVNSLTELGFEKSRCLYAIQLKKNIYSEALNWLIDHSEDSTTLPSYVSSVSLMRTISHNTQENFQRLNQIIRIYGRTGQHHCEKLLKMFRDMGFEANESMKALLASDWDPTRAVDSLLGEQNTTEGPNTLAQNILESSAVQSYLSDPEVFMTIIHLLGSGAGSSGLEHNWESSKLKYQHVASVLKKYNDEKQNNVINSLNLN